MELGKCYEVKRLTYERLETSKIDWGECVWIHPQGRFAVLQFSDGLRDCYWMRDGELEATE